MFPGLLVLAIFKRLTQGGLMHPANAYALYSFLGGLSGGFISLAYVPFLRSINVTLGQVALINSIFFTLITVAELSTGIWADHRSRVRSVRVDEMILTLSMGSYFFAQNVWGALISEVLGAIGSSFISGTIQA